jgi:mRNA interferase MazF
MLRGDIFLVELDPVRGSESSKTRPAVVVSSNAVNESAARRSRGVVTIVPITANLRHVFAFQVLLTSEDTGLALDSKAQAEQVRSVSTERLVRQIGAVGAEKMRHIDDALRLHLSL